MANEISSSVALSVSKNSASFSARADKTFDQSGNVAIQNVQNVGTAAEALSLGDISGVPAMILIQNLDTANYVDVALDSGMTQIFAKIGAGKHALWPPNAAAVYVRANTAAVRILVLACEA